MLLIEVAQRLKSNLRNTDLVGRFDRVMSFAVMEGLSGSAEIAESWNFLLIEKVREQLSKHFQHQWIWILLYQ